MSFFPYSKLHAMVAIVTLAKDCIDVAIVTQQFNIKNCCARLKIMPPVNNFERQPFLKWLKIWD
jgi:hypothetical protein